MPDGSSERGGLTPRMWLSALLLAVAAWVLITFGGVIDDALALIFGAFLLSLAMRPAADYLARWKVPRWLTVILIYLIVLTLLGLIGGITGTAVNRQVTVLLRDAPALVDDAARTLDNLLDDIPWLTNLFPSLDQLGDTLRQAVQQIATALFNAATGAGAFVLELLVVVILSIFFTTDKNIGRSLLVNWVPIAYQPRVTAVVVNSTKRLSRWVVAQLVIMLYTVVAYGAGLLILGVPFAFLIALIGGLLEIVPFIGGVVALTLSILAALTVSPITVVWVVLLYIVVTQIQANVVQPQLYGQAVDIHPALVVIALFIGGQVGGIFGALFAVPIAVVITTFAHEFLRVEANLPDEDSGGSAEAPETPEAAD